jgi:hypothetical protein
VGVAPGRRDAGHGDQEPPHDRQLGVTAGGLSLRYRLHAVPLFLRPSAARSRRFLAWETGGMPLDPVAVSLSSLGGGEYRGAKIVLPHPPTAGRLRAMMLS